MKKLTVALICGVGFGVAHADLYYTGFEVSEGWATGALGTNLEQQPPGGTWGNTSVVQVQPFNPRTGDYSVYFNSAAIGNHSAHFTPDASYSGYSSLTVTYHVYLPAYPEADYGDNHHRFELITDATTLRLQLDNFGTEGLPERHRSFVSSGLGAGGEGGVMNFTWAPAEWTEVSFTLDFVNNVYSYFIDSPTHGLNSMKNQKIGHDISELLGVNLVHRDVGVAQDFTMYVDDFKAKEVEAYDDLRTPPEIGRIDQLINLRSLAVLPQEEVRKWQYSSYDRRSRVSPDGDFIDWGANQDFWSDRTTNNILGVTDDGKYILVDEIGPGVLSWMWCNIPHIPENEPKYVMEFYVDDLDEPRFVATWRQLLEGDIPGFHHGRLSYLDEKQPNSFIPLPYTNRLQVLAVRDNEDLKLPAFYIFAGKSLSQSQDHLGWTDFVSENYQSELDRVNMYLATALGTHPDSYFERNSEEGNVVLQTNSISANSSVNIFEALGGGAISSIRIKVDDSMSYESASSILRSLVIEMRWDGEEHPSVWSPLGPFFGTSPGHHPYQSLPLGVLESGEMYSYWFMPFAAAAEIRIVNLSDETLLVESSVTWTQGADPTDQGYFHARWHKAEWPVMPESRWMDKPMLVTTGRGHVVGLHYHIWNPYGGWWGEGDEKVFVDGELFPSIFGTGTEDFFGFCYGLPAYAQKPYHSVNFNQYATKGHQSLNRFLVADPIPFHESIEFSIERYNEIQFGRMTREWVDKREDSVKLAVVPMWYSEHPSNATNYRSYTLPEITEWYDLEPPIYVEGAVEMEDLPLTVSGGALRNHYWTWMEWSGDTQVVWENAAVGDEMIVPIEVTADGVYRLEVRLNKHQNYGTFLLGFGGQEEHAELAMSQREYLPLDVVFEEVPLSAGVHELTVEAVAISPNADRVQGGFDYYILEMTAGDPEPPGILYETGFEVNEGWAAGSLGTNPEQQPPGGTWGNTSVAQIQPFNSHTGDYSVYFNSAAIGNHSAHFTPDASYSGYSSLTVSYHVYLPAYTEADSGDNHHRFELMTDSATLRLQLDNFGTAGLPERHRSFVSNGLGPGGEGGIMNFVWAPGEWTEVSFTLDFDNNVYSYFVNSPTHGLNAIENQQIGHDISELQGMNLVHRDVGEARDLTMYVDAFLVRGRLRYDRPLLRIGVSPDAGIRILEWPSVEGINYQVEFTDVLTGPDWNVLKEYLATNSMVRVELDILEEHNRGFIRVKYQE